VNDDRKLRSHAKTYCQSQRLWPITQWPERRGGPIVEPYSFAQLTATRQKIIRGLGCWNLNPAHLQP
jgi:hypothetical protein